jgi:hypothetical protein
VQGLSLSGITASAMGVVIAWLPPLFLRKPKRFVSNRCIVRANVPLARHPVSATLFAVLLKFLEFSKQFIRLNRCEG